MGDGKVRAQRVWSFRHVRDAHSRRARAVLPEALEQRIVFCELPHGHDPMLAAALDQHAAAPVAPAAIAAAAAGTFTESVVFSGLTQPTVVRFGGDGRVFVAEKSGVIKVFDHLADTTATVFADLRTSVYNAWDRGLLGMALAPDFATNPYVYVLYTLDAHTNRTAPVWGAVGVDGDPLPTPPGATTNGVVVDGRLSRIPVLPNGTAGPEQVLIEKQWIQQFPSHSTGSLQFGPDGALYASAGDGASFNYVDYGQTSTQPAGGEPRNPASMGDPANEGGALRSQDLRSTGDPTTLHGSIIRVDPNTGDALPSNPLSGSADANARRIIANGLRNPFRFTVRPGTSELWIGDVGWGTWEEINRVVMPTDAAVENFGWPAYEGAARQSGYDNANLPLLEGLYAAGAAAHNAPYYTYNHSAQVVAGSGEPTGGSSISGLAFYNGGNYPTQYQGALFFSDYSRDRIYVMYPGANGLPDPNNRAIFVGPAADPVHLEIGPGGDLFYVALNGSIRRISYSVVNQPPVAVAQASPTNGPAPLSVTFSALASSDPDGDALAYAWDLDGDGAFDDSTAANPTRTYTAPGNVTVSLRVTDALGNSDTDAVVISVNNSAPTAVIDLPASSLAWKVGDVIDFSGHATDPDQGTLPASSLEWALVLMHGSPGAPGFHEHPMQTFVGVDSGSFVAPDHEYPSHLEMRLTATDAGGLQHTTTRVLNPLTVGLTIASSPSGLQLAFNGTSAAAAFSRTVIVGSNNSVSAPTPQNLAGTDYAFSSWSDGGAQTHNITAPAGASTYTAAYAAAVLPAPWVTADIGAVAAAGSASASGGVFTVRGSGADIWNGADEFRFVHRTLSGDGQITARVTGITNTDLWAKAGVMIRDTVSPSSPHAMVVLTPGNGAAFQYRTAAGSVSTHIAGGAAAAPLWVRVVRSGNTLSGYRSADGVTWTALGSATIPMGAQVQVGLAVTAHNDGAINTAMFDNLSVVATPAPTFATARINFQPAAAPAYAGYLVDAGATYANRNGRTYGWNVNNSSTTRDRNSTRSPDQRYDTLIHLQKPKARNAVWEIAVPNGRYAVRVVAGDPSHRDSVYRINAEGVLAVSGTPTSTVRWFEGNVTVNVADGRLTITNGAGAANNKICFIEISQVSPAGVATMSLSTSAAPDSISTPVIRLIRVQRRRMLSTFYGPVSENATAVVHQKKQNAATAAVRGS